MDLVNQGGEQNISQVCASILTTRDPMQKRMVDQGTLNYFSIAALAISGHSEWTRKQNTMMLPPVYSSMPKRYPEGLHKYSTLMVMGCLLPLKHLHFSQKKKLGTNILPLTIRIRIRLSKGQGVQFLRGCQRPY